MLAQLVSWAEDLRKKCGSQEKRVDLAGSKLSGIIAERSGKETNQQIQIPSKKVVWGVFRRLNTFSEGSWIPRVPRPSNTFWRLFNT